MPPHRMHMTVLEIAHSKTPEEISAAVVPLRPIARDLADFTLAHRARLVRPQVTYDAGGVALSFLPAAGEPVVSPAASPAGVREGLEVVGGDPYTYHHLRRDVEGVLAGVGVAVGARYQVPSAHVTLARYLDGEGELGTVEGRKEWVEAVEGINAWLEGEVWGVSGGEGIGEWIVGQERGLHLRCGTVWYGGGRSIIVGEGF